MFSPGERFSLHNKIQKMWGVHRQFRKIKRYNKVSERTYITQLFFRRSVLRQEINLTEDGCGGVEAPFIGTREFFFFLLVPN